jgi:hypothetical protein
MPHDTDRTQLEYGSELSEYAEFPELASEQYEYAGGAGTVLGEIIGEAQSEGTFETGAFQEYQELPEVMHDELASELLEVRSDQELDHFLGSLFSKVASTVGKVIKSPVGQALGGILKQVAKKALPIAGGALGTFVGGPLGGMVGGKLASMAGDAFGLEVEGLSREDRDFEMARRYVRFASHAAKRAAAAPPHIDPTTVAKAAVIEAAKKYAPGLLAPPRIDAATAAARAQAQVNAALAGARPTAAPAYVSPAYRPAVPTPAVPGAYPYTDYGTYPTQPACPTCGTTPMRYKRAGKWIRRGRHIVLLGV